MQNNKSVSDLIPVWHFDNDLVVYSDGSLGAGFKLSGIDISCESASVINELSTNLENLLGSARDGLKLQVFYKLSSNVLPLIEAHSEISKKAPEVYRPVAKARLNFLKKNALNKNYFQPEIYFFIRSEPLKYKRKNLFDKPEKFSQTSIENYNKHKDKFLRAVKQVESSLSHAKLTPQRLIKDEWFRVLFEYFNLSKLEKLGSPKLRTSAGVFSSTLADQIASTDIEIHRDSVRIDDYFFKVITLKQLPEGFTYPGMIEAFTKLPFHFWMSQSVTVHDQKSEIEKLQVQRRLAHSMASGSQKISDLESESKLAHTEELIGELLEGSEKIISSDLSVILWSKDKNDLTEKSDEVLKAFRNMNQSEGLVETLPCFDAFIAATPGMCGGLRHKKMKTSNAGHLMPVFSYWSGNPRPVCLLPNRDSVLFGLDIFEPSLPAWNGITVGGTGSGKSFTIQQLALQFYGQSPRPRLIWIESGASSQNLLEAMDGEFIDLTLDSGICLNMFELQPGQKEPDSSKIKLILGVLESVLKDEEKFGLPKRDKALLEEAIMRLYSESKGKTPVLSDLKKKLAKHPVEEMRTYAEILYSWTGNTAYGRMIDGPSNVRLNRDLIAVELRGLDNHPQLQNLFLMLFTDFIKNEAANDLKRPYLLIIDEAWRLFRGTGGDASSKSQKHFALSLYREARKYRLGIWSVTQNYRDLLADPDVAEAILPNTTHVFILRQRKIDWEDLKDVFDFNDAQISAIKSLEIKKGVFSEVYYIQDERHTILRIIPDPLSYWVCTSDGMDKAHIKEMQEKNLSKSKIEILEEIAFNQNKKTEAA